ncbi:MAG: hypothetical protein V1917_00915 [Candidatus Gottesmanbacteria bacterium]
MKHIISLIIAGIIAMPIYAANSGGAQATQQQTQVQISKTVTPSGVQVQNKNQVQTQNQGSASNLMVQTSEQEKQAQTLNSVGVAAETLKALSSSYSMGSIVKKQVEDVVKGQMLAHDVITQNIQKIDAKSGFSRFLTGTDHRSVKALSSQVEQNRLRIEQLMQLKIQVFNTSDQTKIQEAVDALIQENTALEERVLAERKGFSMFGWLIAFLNN